MRALLSLSLFVVVASTTPLHAQNVVDDEDPHVPLLQGTLSADGDQTAADAEVAANPFPRQSMLEPWFAWKQGVQERTGLSFGGSYGLLHQNYSDSLIDQRDSTGAKLTLNMAYELFRKGTPEALVVAVAVEDRRPVFGSDQPPLFAGFGAGSLVPTAATWGQFDLGVTQAYIRQNLFGNRFQYTVGKIFAPNFVNAYPFFDDNRQFLSQAFSTSPSIQSPLRGFGAVAAWYPSANGLYLQAGMYTSHSDDTGSTVDDFFNTSEHFYHFDVGWTGRPRAGLAIAARGPTDSDNLHVSGWYRNAQDDGTPKSHGVAFNANRMLSEQVMVFFRGGFSQGWAVETTLAGGVGWRPTGQPSNLVGIGLGWADPAASVLRSQYTVEAFYRFHITRNLAITPDIQAVIDPSTHPDESLLWVLSLRARVTF